MRLPGAERAIVAARPGSRVPVPTVQTPGPGESSIFGNDWFWREEPARAGKKTLF